MAQTKGGSTKNLQFSNIVVLIYVLLSFSNYAWSKSIGKDLSETRSRAKRDLNVIKFDFFPRSNNFEIPYEISTELQDDRFIENLNEVIDDFQSNTCIHLVPRTTEDKFIRFYSGSHCSSPIGAGSGIVEVSLPEKCWIKGTMIHEVMHALGFFHENTRPDRDEHIIVRKENVSPSNLYNFEKYSTDPSKVPSTPYDTWSVMHYGSYYLSTNGQPTMTDMEGQNLRTQSEGFSKGDVEKINVMYQCTPVITGSGGSEEAAPSCVDKANSFTCGYWVRMGQCTGINAAFALQQCCASCSAVTTTTTMATTTTENPMCFDLSSICSFFARTNGCESNISYGLRRCCKTCRLGHLITGASTEESATTTETTTIIEIQTTTTEEKLNKEKTLTTTSKITDENLTLATTVTENSKAISTPEIELSTLRVTTTDKTTEKHLSSSNNPTLSEAGTVTSPELREEHIKDVTNTSGGSVILYKTEKPTFSEVVTVTIPEIREEMIRDVTTTSGGSSRSYSGNGIVAAWIFPIALVRFLSDV